MQAIQHFLIKNAYSLDSFQIFYRFSAIYLHISCIFIIFAVGLLPFRFE